MKLNASSENTEKIDSSRVGEKKLGFCTSHSQSSRKKQSCDDVPHLVKKRVLNEWRGVEMKKDIHQVRGNGKALLFANKISSTFSSASQIMEKNTGENEWFHQHEVLKTKQ